MTSGRAADAALPGKVEKNREKAKTARKNTFDLMLLLHTDTVYNLEDYSMRAGAGQ
jgi:hypothetical protein